MKPGTVIVNTCIPAFERLRLVDLCEFESGLVNRGKPCPKKESLVLFICRNLYSVYKFSINWVCNNI